MIGSLPRAHLLKLVLNIQLQKGFKGIFQRIQVRLDQGGLIPEGLESFEGRGLADSFFQGEEAYQVHQGQNPLKLQVKGMAMGLLFFKEKVSDQTASGNWTWRQSGTYRCFLRTRKHKVVLA